jgi:subtilase family serine protease
MSRRLAVAITLVSVTVALFLPVAAVTSAAQRPQAAQREVVLRSAVPEQVRSGHARSLGRVAPSSPINLAVTLKLRNMSKLNATLAAIGSPASPEYRRYLSQTQANELFDPTVTQQNAVAGWLRPRA